VQRRPVKLQYLRAKLPGHCAVTGRRGKVWKYYFN
jgi:hypothetical protein